MNNITPQLTEVKSYKYSYKNEVSSLCKISGSAYIFVCFNGDIFFNTI